MLRNALPAALISILAALASGSAATLYRIELAGNAAVLSEDRPRETATSLLFHRHPGGVLMSVRKSDVRRVVAAPRLPASSSPLSPGGQVELGPTGGGAARAAPSASSAPARAPGEPLAPGEDKGGTALFNPDRSYRPEWDGRQVPGLSLGYPNSANDYREGRTFAHPPASATQPAPGAPPVMPTGNGEAPRPPQ